MQRYILIVLVGFISIHAYAQTDEVFNIKEQSAKFSSLMVEGDRETMLKLYTTDAKIFPNNREILSGEDLRQYWMPKEGSDYKVLYHKATPEEIKIFGDEAYDWGYYEGRSVSNGKESSWKGKYVIIWKKEQGEWKMYLDIWNRVGQ